MVALHRAAALFLSPAHAAGECLRRYCDGESRPLLWCAKYLFVAGFVLAERVRIFTPHDGEQDEPFMTAVTSHGSLMTLGTQPFALVHTYHSILKLTPLRSRSPLDDGSEALEREDVSVMCGFALSVAHSFFVGQTHGGRVALCLCVVACALAQCIAVTARLAVAAAAKRDGGQRRKRGGMVGLTSTLLMIHLCDKLSAVVCADPLSPAAITVLATSLVFVVMHDCRVNFAFASTRERNVRDTHSLPLMVHGISPMVTYMTLYESAAAACHANRHLVAAMAAVTAAATPLVVELAKTVSFAACTWYFAAIDDEVTATDIVSRFKERHMRLAGWGERGATRYLADNIRQLKLVNVLVLWTFWLSRYLVSSVSLLSVLQCVDLSLEHMPSAPRGTKGSWRRLLFK